MGSVCEVVSFCRIYSEEESFLLFLLDILSILGILALLGGLSGEALLTHFVEEGAGFVKGKIGFVGAVVSFRVVALFSFNALLGLLSALFFNEAKVVHEPGLGVRTNEHHGDNVADLSDGVDGEVDVEASGGELLGECEHQHVEGDVDEGDQDGDPHAPSVRDVVPEVDHVHEPHEDGHDEKEQVPETVSCIDGGI